MITNLVWVWRHLARPHVGQLSLLAVLFTVGAVAPALQPLVAGGIADRVVGQEMSAAIWLLVIAMAATFIVPAALENFADLVQAKVDERTIRTVDQMIIRTGGELTDLSALERPEIHDQVQLVDRQVPMYARLSPSALRVVAHAIGAITLLVSVGTLAWWLPLVLLAAGIPHMIGERKMIKARFNVMRDQSRATREMDYCLSAASQPQLAKEVRAFGLGRFFLDRFDSRSRPSLAELGQVRIRSAGVAGLGALAYALAVVICFLYIANRASAGLMTIGDIALYLTAITVLFTTLFNLGIQGGVLMETVHSVDALRILVRESRPGITIATDGPAAPPRLEQDLVLRDVHFAYPRSEDGADVLRGVDLVVPAGRVLALVGENGEGKSTLVKLLARMYDPTDGTITLDGRPLSDYDLGSLRSRIATVYQDHARFALTFEENIGIGVPSLIGPDAPAEDRRELLAAAAAKGGADTVAATLPEGETTELTRQFGGVELSGGEWQRVATARAFLPDAALVILDEPTSALDVDAERRLFDTFSELVQGRTAIMISHRFSTVRTADVIAVLADGRIAEYGSHDELMAAGGHYAELFNLQADRFRD